jgi:hypothetical protein
MGLCPAADACERFSLHVPGTTLVTNDRIQTGKWFYLEPDQLKEAKMSKRESYLVTLERPDGVSVAEMKQYIVDSVGSWRGSFRPPGGMGEDDPGDLLFNLDAKSISVAKMKGK